MEVGDGAFQLVLGFGVGDRLLLGAGAAAEAGIEGVDDADAAGHGLELAFGVEQFGD